MSKRTNDAVLLAVLLLGLVVCVVLFAFFAMHISSTSVQPLKVTEPETVPVILQANSVPTTYDASNDPYPSIIHPVVKRSRHNDEVTPSSDLTNGLALYLSFDEGSNVTSFDDSSSNANLATCSNEHCPMSGVSGKIGRAVQFDGVNDYLSVANDASYHSDNAITLAAWVNWEQPIYQLSTLLWKSQGSDCPDLPYCSNREFFLAVYGDGRMHLASTPVNSNTQIPIASAPGSFPAGQWHYVTGVIDANASVMKLYIDGHLADERHEAALSAGIRSSNGPLLIGNVISTHGDAPFKGKIDELRIYNRALSVDEINALRNL